MADMLQMTYSEMENLVKALKTSSDDLENLSSQIMSLISEIQDAVGIKWLKTIVSHTDILNNTIYYLNDISSTTGETWQGERYENFSGKILPSIINASEIITNKEDEFKEGLKAEIKPILENLQKIAGDFKKQGAECGAQSIWIAQYLKEHQGVEAQSGPTNTSKTNADNEKINDELRNLSSKDIDDMTNDELEKYYDLLCKLDSDNLTDEQKKWIQNYIDYLKDNPFAMYPFGDKKEQYRNLMLMLHPENPGGWKTIDPSVNDATSNTNLPNKKWRKSDTENFIRNNIIGSILPGAGIIMDIGTIHDIKKRQNAYNENCTRCIATYEMRRRGLDVKANPVYDIDDDYLAHHPYDMWKDPDIHVVKSSSDTERISCIENEMKKYGDGSRVQIRVGWGNGGGHTFIAEQVNGETIFIDPQHGTIDYKSWAKNAKSVTFCRIDNLKPSTRIFDCCKES